MFVDVNQVDISPVRFDFLGRRTVGLQHIASSSSLATGGQGSVGGLVAEGGCAQGGGGGGGGHVEQPLLPLLASLEHESVYSLQATDISFGTILAMTQAVIKHSSTSTRHLEKI